MTATCKGMEVGGEEGRGGMSNLWGLRQSDKQITA